MVNNNPARLNAVHGINRYLYDKGKATGIFASENRYGGRTAFVPVNRIGQFSIMKYTETDGSQKSVDYIVYNWLSNDTGFDYFVKNEQVIYLIYSDDFETIRRMSNFITDTMNEYDRSATNVQAYLEKLTYGADGGWGTSPGNPYLALEYYSISLDGSNGPTPITEYGGRMEALITLNVKYAIVGNQTGTSFLPEDED